MAKMNLKSILAIFYEEGDEMQFLSRDLTERIIAMSREYACLLVSGPRQVGKTTLLRSIEPNRTYVTLDDLEERRLAKMEPATFLQLHQPPVLIDEVQYAPELFSYIKMAVDAGAAPGAFWLTGSQAFHLMELAQESLAGRTALFHLPSLSQHEIYGSGDNAVFSTDMTALQERAKRGRETDLSGIYERIWRGSMPGLISGKYTDWNMFYSSYVATYISRDVSEMLERVDRLQFQDFIRAVACRVGQMLNVHSIAMDVGVSDKTAKHWLKILEASDIIFYLRPYTNNLLKRAVKQAKMYFFDTGLVAYLTAYLSPEILAKGALSGAILENYVVAEIRKTFYNAGRQGNFWYYRDRSGAEIDMVLEENGYLYPLEIKRMANPSASLVHAFAVMDKGALPRGNGAILCTRQQLTAIDAKNYVVPIWML